MWVCFFFSPANFHALGYTKNKINTAVRFVKMSTDNNGHYDNIWKQ